MQPPKQRVFAAAVADDEDLQLFFQPSLNASRTRRVRATFATPTRRVRSTDAPGDKGRGLGCSGIFEHKQNKSYFASGFGEVGFRLKF